MSSKLSLPQQVIIARRAIAIVGASTLEAYEIPLGLGEDEVAIVLAAKLAHRGASTAHVQQWLSRRSTKKIPTDLTWANEAGSWQDDGSVFDWFASFKTEHTAVGVENRSCEEYKVYPYPIVLIRDPSMLVFSNMATVLCTVILYYLIEKVTNEQLAKLMVKDHA